MYKTPCYGESEFSPELNLDDELISAISPIFNDVPIYVTWFTGDLTTQIGETEYVNGIAMYDALIYSFKKGKLTTREIIKKSK